MSALDQRSVPASRQVLQRRDHLGLVKLPQLRQFLGLDFDLKKPHVHGAHSINFGCHFGGILLGLSTVVVLNKILHGMLPGSSLRNNAQRLE
jgi:hypothetical protein